MLIHVDDQRDFLIYAFRYALPRSTYASWTVSKAIIGAWDQLSPFDKTLIRREIIEAITFNRAGMECDRHSWERILELEH